MSKKENNVTGEKLRFIRKNCGLTQTQVAQALGVDRTTYGGYENGRTEPNLITIVKLSQIFRVEPTAILPSEGDELNLKDINENSDTIAKPIYSLTKNEQALLISFRALSDKGKKRLLAKITNMTKTDK